MPFVKKYEKERFTLHHQAIVCPNGPGMRDRIACMLCLKQVTSIKQRPNGSFIITVK
jgi:hypothetical protein